MIRPRFTLTRIALAGAGLLTAAGIGAAAIPQVIASAPTAAATTVPTPKIGTPANGTTPAAGQKQKGHKGQKANLKRLGVVLHRVLVREVAQQTGMTAQQVRTQLKSGKSLDTIAGSKAQAVKDAALDVITKRLDAARANGTITQAQETTLVGRAKDRITKVMAATPKPKPAVKPAV